MIGLELPRKILHSSISILVAFVYLSHPTVTGLLRVLSIALFIIISADLLRFNSKPFSRVYNALLGLFMREEEATQVNGVVYYLVGTIFVTAFLPRGQ
jgi:diacylglycerol kinase (CTP)